MSSVLGVPLEFLLEEMKKNNILVSWTHFYDSSVEHLWKYSTTRDRVSYSVFEVYGPEYRDEVLKRLDFYFIRTQCPDKCPDKCLDRTLGS
jgi:hypothetical protein